MKKIFVCLALVSGSLMLSGCHNSIQEPEPVGIGTSINDLQKSPCACDIVPMKLPPWAHQKGNIITNIG